jgi:hypothetical protein
MKGKAQDCFMEIKIGPSLLPSSAIAHSRFTPLVHEFNRSPAGSSIHFDRRLRGKEYLLAVRALAHSTITQAELHVTYDRASEWPEDISYPLSLAFGTSLRLQRKQTVEGTGLVTFVFELRKNAFAIAPAFGVYVLSNGKDTGKLQAALTSIEVAKSSCANQVQVYVVGPTRELEAFRNSSGISFEILDDQTVYTAGELRFPISKKKNLICLC